MRLFAAPVPPRQDDRLVIAEKPYLPTRPGVTPGESRCHDGKQLLPLNGVLELVGLPRVVEPRPPEIRATAESAGRVGEQLEVGCCGGVRRDEFRRSVPGGKKVLPP